MTEFSYPHQGHPYKHRHQETGVFLSSVYPRRLQVTTLPPRPGTPPRGKASFPAQSHCGRRHGQALSPTSRAAIPRAMALAPRQTLRPAVGVPLCTRALPPHPCTRWEAGLHAQQAHVAARTRPFWDARGTASMPPGTGPLWKPGVGRAPLASKWL